MKLELAGGWLEWGEIWKKKKALLFPLGSKMIELFLQGEPFFCNYSFPIGIPPSISLLCFVYARYIDMMGVMGLTTNGIGLLGYFSFVYCLSCMRLAYLGAWNLGVGGTF